MIGILAGTFLGVCLGIISGLVPGIHANTVAGFMLGTYPVLLPLMGPGSVAGAMFSTLITHTFLDILPATFFGLPDPDTSLSVLPAHALALSGKAEEAVRLSALGSLWGVVFVLPVCGFAFLVLAPLQGYIDWGTGILLIFVMGLLIVMSEAPVWSFAVFLVSGLLGLFSFHFQYLSWHTFGSSGVLMPLLTGLFGISVLLVSSDEPIPAQHFTGLGCTCNDVIRASVPGTLAGSVVGWMPGLSNATANAVLTSFFSVNSDPRRYIISTSAANTSNALLGLAALFAVSRTRNGIMVALSSLEIPDFNELLLCGLCAAFIAYILTVSLSKSAHILSGIDGKWLNWIVICFVTLLCVFLTGPFGLLILLLATFLGFVPYLVNIQRVFCIGAVTLPVIMFSFGFS